MLVPLLLFVYINDLHNAIIYNPTILQMTLIFLIYVNLLKKVQKQLNTDLKLFYNCLLANKISLNDIETKLLSLSDQTLQPI